MNIRAILATCLLAVATVLPAHASLITYDAVLGDFEAVPTGSAGTGTALVTYDDVAHTLRVLVTFSGLSGNTSASHIHCCTPAPNTGTAGVATQLPTFVGFPLGVKAGTYDNTLDLTQSSSWNAAFINANGGTTAGAEAALVGGLNADKAYLNIHTNLFPGGEIRGFLHRVPEPGTLALLGLGLAGLAASRWRKQ